MIAFASIVAEPEPFERFARPGIERAMEPGSEVIILASLHPAARSLNLVLDAAMELEDLEALVIVDPFTELLGSGLCRTVREAFADPEVAVLGVYGGSGFRGTAWWEGEVRGHPAEHHYRELGSGSKELYPWLAGCDGPGEVEAVNEMVVVLSPWAVRNLRFDESLHLRHGVEIDLCHQARAAGRKVRVEPIDFRYHGPLAFNADRRQIQVWQEAHIALSSKWTHDPTPQDPNSPEWEHRARQAEAEREAARAFSYPLDLALEAQRERLEGELAEYTGSIGWKLTSPLRRLNATQRERRNR